MTDINIVDQGGNSIGQSATPYDEVFFDTVSAGSLKSARVVVPIILELVSPQSVLDVGCGLGTWLAAFTERGITDFLGIDGEYIDKNRLNIPASRFRSMDLTRPFPVGRTFDLAVCLEVAEHLPEDSSNRLVKFLTNAAPVVAFSAAIPGQGGVNHINEQWPLYWQQHFAEYGFIRLDPIRPRIWRDSRVELWYQQNLVLFVREDELATRPALEAERAVCVRHPFELVLSRLIPQSRGIRTILSEFPSELWQAVRRRLRR